MDVQDEPRLQVRGAVIVAEPPARVAYTWSWTTRWERVERRVPTGVMSKDLVTGEIIAVTRMEWVDELVDSWMLPPEPSTVHIGIRRADKGVTAIELEHRDLPVELAAYVQPFWEWALRRELPRGLAKAPFYGFPWNRGGRYALICESPASAVRNPPNLLIQPELRPPWWNPIVSLPMTKAWNGRK